MTLYKLKFKNDKVSILRLISGEIEDQLQKREDFKDIISYEIIEEKDVPVSRNYRDAWTHDLNIDIEKAKKIHRGLIIKAAKKRVEKDEFGNQDFSTVKAEIDALDIDGAKDLTELYNTWPKSIETRTTKREYKIKRDDV